MSSFLCQLGRNIAKCVHLILYIHTINWWLCADVKFTANSNAIMNKVPAIDKYIQLNHRVNHEIA
jgi:hypothetical protein